MSRQNTFQLLKRSPIFRNFLTASTISMLGSSIFDLSMPLYVFARTGSAVALALTHVALNLPYFLMAPFTGYWADHFDKRRVMLVTDIGQVLCLMFLLCYDLTASAAMWPILAGIFVIKTLMILFETVTTFQLIPGLVKPSDLATANASFLSMLRLIQVVGPLVGGAMMGAFGVRGCIVVNLVSFAATLHFVTKTKNLADLLGEPGVRKRNASFAKGVSISFMESVKFIWASKVFRVFIPLMFLWNLSPLIPNTPTLTFYFTATKGLSAAEYGSIMSMIGMFGLVGYLMSNYFFDRMEFGTAFYAAAIWQAVLASVALLFFPHPLLLAVIFAFSRAGSSVLNMGTFLIRQTHVPKERMGGVNACLRMFFMSAAPLSSLLQGALIDTVGVLPSLILGGLCLWGVVYYARELTRQLAKKAAERLHQEAAAAA